MITIQKKEVRAFAHQRRRALTADIVGVAESTMQSPDAIIIRQRDDSVVAHAFPFSNFLRLDREHTAASASFLISLGLPHF